MAQVAQDWPISYPAIVTKNFQPPQGLGFVRANINDKVKCVSRINTNNQVQIQYPNNRDGSRGRTGWIDRACLNIGTSAKVGDRIEVHLSTPWIPWLGQDTRSAIINDAHGRFHKTVLGLINSYWDHRKDYPTEPLYLQAYIGTQQQRDLLTQEIVAGTRAVGNQWYNALNTDEFTLQQLRSLCPRVSNANEPNRNRTGIYGIQASGFPDPNRGPELYIGSTIAGFGERWNGHLQRLNQARPRGVLYRSGAAANSCHMYALCYILQGSADAEGEKMRIVEQVFVDLFQTQSSVVLNLRSVEAAPDDIDGQRSTTDGETLTRAARYANDKDEAIVFKRLASEVFELSGWPLAIDRVQPGSTRFGAVRGLNWSSPLTERMHTKVTWTKVEVPGHFANFRRTGLVINEVQGRRHVAYFGCHRLNGGGEQVTVWLPKGDPGPAVGTPVDLVVEIKLDGQPSEVPYGIQPTIGFMNDFRESTYVALRIEWHVGNGQWDYRYLQLGSSYNTVSPGAPSECTLGYLTATGLRAYFLQEERHSTDEFPWLYDFGLAKIKQVEVDHLTQTIVSRTVWRTHRARQVPLQRVSPDQMAGQLLALGADYVARSADTRYPPFPQGTRLNPNNLGPARKRCDFCHFGEVVGGHSQTTLDCKKVEGRPLCGPCQRFKRCCAYTHDGNFRNSQELRLASINPATVRPVVNRVNPRLLVQF